MEKLSTSQTDEGKIGEIVDEILSKIGQGEKPDIEAYARQHPEVADILKHALPALRAVADSVGGSGSNADNHALLNPGKSLGDFRILRELGRGGMGVVYEAQQISLDRKVALKVLPFAGLIRENALQRFHNEVRAAAALDHQNIVSVYFIGEERGVHYYAMQLIQGQTLADVIAQLVVLRRSKAPVTGESLSHAICGSDLSARSSATDLTEQHSQLPGLVSPPSTRRAIQANADTLVTSGHDRQFYQSIANLGIQAADALQHAHDNGVLHRDIKPGNLMLDSESQLYITDFGLARIETDANITMTGDLIGTLRYMSPEQAIAKRGVIDHRGDIYSLGATLYEAMTLSPLFIAEDRQDLLKQIAFGEPTKLRKIERSIPSELETIVHKAIAKNPDERYATAEELADDLRAFQQNRPIKAKPPTMMQRSGKWAQRHQGVVVAAAAVLLISMLGLAGATVAISQEQSQTKAALGEAENNLKEAKRQRQLAEENFQRARDAVDQYLTRVSEDQLLNAPGMQPLRKDLLELALKYYEKFIDDRADDPGLQSEFAAALHRVADIRFTLGNTTEAHKLHQQGLDIRLKLVESNPNDEDLLHSLAKSYILVSFGQSTFSERIGRLEKAIAIAEPLRAPEHLATLANALFELGAAHVSQFSSEGGLAKMEDARKAYSRSIQILEYLQKKHPDQSPELLPRAYSRLANWHTVMDRPEESEQLNLKALAIAEQLAAANPNDLGHQESLAGRYWNVGQYDKSVEVSEKLAKRNPLVVRYQMSLAASYGRLANIRRKQPDKQQEAVEWAKKSVAVCARLARDDPESKDYQAELGVKQATLARCLLGTGRADEAIKALELAIDSLTGTGIYKPVLADAHLDLGRTLERAGRLEEAIEAQRSSVNLMEQAPPGQIHFRSTTAKQFQRLGDLLRDAGKLEQAWDAYKRAVQILQQMFVDGKTPEGTPDQIRNARQWLASAQQSLLDIVSELGSDTENDRSELIDKFYSNAERNDFWFLISRGVWHRSHGELELALDDFRRASEQEPSSDAKDHTILLLLEQNCFSEAVEELPNAADLDSTRLFLRYVSVLAFVGEATRYREMCASLLERFGSSDSLGDIELCCKLCSLLPNVVEPAKIPLKELGRGIAAGEAPAKHHHWYDIGLAMARYRTGDWEQARTSIREAQSREVYDSQAKARALALSVLAMAEHHLGNFEAAAVALNEASELLEQQWPTIFHNDAPGSSWPDWPNWLIVKTMHREAATLLGQ